MKIYLSTRDDEVIDVWKIYFKDVDFITITKQDVVDVKAEAAVSPANSFCFYTGGIDLHYRNHFGMGMQNELQEKVKALKHKELLVGDALSVAVNHPQSTIKYVISAPTMRVPEGVAHTLNVYLAVRAALVEAQILGVESVVIPGMGMGTGGVTPQDFAKQARAAVNDVLINEPPFPSNVYEAQAHVRSNIATVPYMEAQVKFNN